MQMDLLDCLICFLVYAAIVSMWRDSKKYELDEEMPPWIQDPWGKGKD